MENNQKYNQEFKFLIEKYLDSKISIEEVKKLVNYYESFQKSHEWVEELGSESMIKNKMLFNILEAIETEVPVKVIPFYKRNIFKYAVAASLVACIALGSLYKQILAVDASVEAPLNIQIGTNKATLTLEDGTNIILDKETDYHSKKLSSNGQSLLYNKAEKINEKVVYNYLTIPRGGQFFVELSDGTKVWINSESKLKYPVSFVKGKPREVELVYGEAYFEVTKSTQHNGDAFFLKTNEQHITVLGTMFNVKAYRNETEILTTLVEGKVSVSNSINKRILNPGEQSKLSQDNSDFEIYEVELDDEVSWRTGEFSFTNKPLEDIMKVLERWYNIDIHITNEEMKKIGFTGVISKNQSIDYILEIIKTTNNMTYEIKKNNIIIK
ncbi:FecR family protein [Polaribacter sp. Asnod1-A03]|uniref:FecR family protein n=1 Tax=Polaribacter sp. Asnod1-A03 TaxID=3160581 RepID=UPI003870620E